MKNEAIQKLLLQIRLDVENTQSRTGVSQIRESILTAIANTPRHEFVPQAYRERAWEDEPVPIGHGQTASQPFIVALMTELLDVKAKNKVLEIGTGSGYQAAILAQVVHQVYSIEAIAELGSAAKKRLQRLGYTNVDVHIGDGNKGLVQFAPYDGIIVTAVAPEVPAELIKQLGPGKNLVIPIVKEDGSHDLVVITKGNNGETTTRSILPVRFVPLVQMPD